jgi:hypothetical protein
MAFAIVRTQAPHRHSQARFLGVQVFRVGGRKTCGQRSTVATSENADVDVRCLDFAEVRVLWVSVASTELLEHYR